MPMTENRQNTIGGELLRKFVERIENIDGEIKDLQADKAVVMAEARAENLIPAGIRYIVKKRKMKPSARAEAETLEDLYLHAMGMEPNNPLFRATALMEVDILSRESVVEAMKKFVPTNGSITVDAGGTAMRLTRDAKGDVSVTEVIERKVETTASVKGTKPVAERVDVPDVTEDAAEALGHAAFKEDVAIIANPFPFGDARRPRWDKGWRDESGTDGMGPGGG